MKPSKRQTQTPRQEWPAVIYFWAFGLSIMSHVVARIVLDGQPHPYHWLSALAGGLAGLGIGSLWFLWRGDLF